MTNVTPKTIAVSTPKTLTFSCIEDVHDSRDTATRKRLEIQLTPRECGQSHVLIIQGDEYDAFDQTSDATIKAGIIAKFGLQAV